MVNIAKQLLEVQINRLKRQIEELDAECEPNSILAHHQIIGRREAYLAELEMKQKEFDNWKE